MIKRVEGWVRQSKAGRTSQSATVVQTAMDSAKLSQKSTSACTSREKQPLDMQKGSDTRATSLTEEEKDKTSQNGNDQPGDSAVGVTSPDNVSDRVIPHEGSSVDKPDIDAVPEFPLLPASKGFCMTICKHLDDFRKSIDSIKGS